MLRGERRVASYGGHGKGFWLRDRRWGCGPGEGDDADRGRGISWIASGGRARRRVVCLRLLFAFEGRTDLQRPSAQGGRRVKLAEPPARCPGESAPHDVLGGGQVTGGCGVGEVGEVPRSIVSDQGDDVARRLGAIARVLGQEGVRQAAEVWRELRDQLIQARGHLLHDQSGRARACAAAPRGPRAGDGCPRRPRRR